MFLVISVVRNGFLKLKLSPVPICVRHQHYSLDQLNVLSTTKYMIFLREAKTTRVVPLTEIQIPLKQQTPDFRLVSFQYTDASHIGTMAYPVISSLLLINNCMCVSTPDTRKTHKESHTTSNSSFSYLLTVNPFFCITLSKQFLKL